jgi:hypothetical protein
MNNELIIFVPNIILLALFVIFLWRRHSLKNFDWATLVCITLGVSLLAVIIVLFMRSQTAEGGSLRMVLIAVPALAFVLFLLFLTRVLTVEKVKSKFHFDERITTMNAKSARNALAAVYLSITIDLITFSDISTVLLLVILAVSLVVYLASMLIYYFRSF